MKFLIFETEQEAQTSSVLIFETEVKKRIPCCVDRGITAWSTPLQRVTDGKWYINKPHDFIELCDSIASICTVEDFDLSWVPEEEE